MHTLAAFYESMANGSVYAEVNGVLDQVLNTDASNRVQVPWDATILGAYVAGANLTAARFNAPSLRNLVLPEINPVATAVIPPSPSPYVAERERGNRLKSGEYFITEISRGGAGASDVFAGAWIAPQLAPAPSGPSYTLVGSFTSTLVVGSWVLGVLTFNQQLPVGRYAVVGMAVVVTSGIFARLAYPGSPQFRPGVVVQPTLGNLIQNDPFRYGRFGSFGEFEYNVPPNIETMGTTAGAQTGAVYLDIVKVR